MNSQLGRVQEQSVIKVRKFHREKRDFIAETGRHYFTIPSLALSTTVLSWDQ